MLNLKNYQFLHLRIKSHVLIHAIAFLLLLGSTIYYRSYTYGFSTLDWDEITYLIMGEGILRGMIPFVDLWDIKPIGLYLIYSLAIPLLGYKTETIRILTIVFTFWGSFMVYLFYRKQNYILAIFLGFFYQLSFLFLLSGMAGNTEVFFIPFVLTGLYLIQKNKSHLTALGCFLLGLGFIIKYIIIFELFFMLGFLVILDLYRTKFNWKKIPRIILPYTTIFLPFTMYFIVYSILGHTDVWLDTIQLTSSGYSLPTEFIEKLLFLFIFLSSKTALILVVFMLVLISIGKFYNIKIHFWDTRKPILFVLWVVGAVIGSVWTGYFYEHYLLNVVPGFVLLCGYWIVKYLKFINLKFTISIFLILFLVTLFYGEQDRKSYKNTLKNLPDTPKQIALDIKANNWGSNIFIASGMHTPYVYLNLLPPVSFVQPYNYTNFRFAEKIGLNPIDIIDSVIQQKVDLIQVCDIESKEFNQEIVRVIQDKYFELKNYFPSCVLYKRID